MKKKILWVGEFNAMSTGYSVFTQEVLKRLFLNYSDKFEIAEMASYASMDDPRVYDAPWKLYPTKPSKNDKAETDKYNSDAQNQFGKWKFEEICLDFQPDIVIDVRDYWYTNYQFYSPFRHLYSLVQVPTVDAFPQQAEWINDYSTLDACFAYTKWGEGVLKQQSNGKINLCGLAPPGVDTNVFQPLGNKRQLKESLGLSPDALIVGTVMRNQNRKLYPNLFESFTRYLYDAPKELADRTMLYCHTAWPDLGYDIPELIKEFGLGNKVLFTYVCREQGCGTVFSSYFQDSRSVCKNCGKSNAGFAVSGNGINNNHLNIVYNLFDIYVQYVNAEGLGMPTIEAAAAGVPVICPYYAGLCEIVDKINAIPVGISSFNKEPSSGRYMSTPNNEDFVKKLIEVLKLPSSIRASYGFKSRELTKQHFKWDDTVKNLVKVFNTLPKKDWLSKPKLYQPNLNVPDNLTNQQFINHIFTHILGKPELSNSYIAARMTRDLNWGFSPNKVHNYYFAEEALLGQLPDFQEFNRNDAAKVLVERIGFENSWEWARGQKLKLI